MNIAFVSHADPLSISNWSGTPRHMVAGFEANDVAVVPIGPLVVPFRPVWDRAMRAHNKVSRTRYDWEREGAILRSYAAQIRRRLRTEHVDALIAPGTIPVSYLETEVPVLIWTDAIVDLMIGYQDWFTGLSRRAVANARRAERRALASAGAFFSASSWCLDAARKHYSLSPARSHEVAFGANITSDPGPIERTLKGATHVLSVGVDWHSKGMATTIRAVETVRTDGREVVLDILGCEPPPGVEGRDFVNIHGRVDKTTTEGAASFDRLFRQADVMMLATKAECFGVVFAEAAAYSLPVIAPSTGGVPSAVKDGTSGLLVSEDAAPADYATALLRLLDEPSLYSELSQGAREEFEARLNWPTAARRVLEHARL